MEYTELDDYSLPGGRLTTWEPQTAPQAWRDDPRRLSYICLLYTSPSPRDRTRSRMPSSA